MAVVFRNSQCQQISLVRLELVLECKQQVDARVEGAKTKKETEREMCEMTGKYLKFTRGWILL